MIAHCAKCKKRNYGASYGTACKRCGATLAQRTVPVRSPAEAAGYLAVGATALAGGILLPSSMLVGPFVALSGVLVIATGLAHLMKGAA